MPVTPRKWESVRATPHKSERPEGMDDGPIGCGAPGVACVVGRAGVVAPGVAICPCSATKENGLYSRLR